MQVYGLDDGELLRAFDGDHREIALRVTREGRLYLSSAPGPNVVQVRDVLTRAPVGRPTVMRSDVTAVALGEVGERLVALTGSSDGGVRVWDARTGEELAEPSGHAAGGVRSLALARVGPMHILATGSADWTAQVWHVPGGAPTGPPLPHPMPVLGVAFAELEGRTMLGTACEDGKTRLWDPIRASGGRIAAEGWLPSVALDDGVVAAATEDGRVRLWKTGGNMIGELVLGAADGGVFGVAVGQEITVTVSGYVLFGCLLRVLAVRLSPETFLRGLHSSRPRQLRSGDHVR